MENVLNQLGKGVTTLLQELQQRRRTQAEYLSQAQTAQEQADLLAAAATQKNTYLLQSAAEKARSVYQNYRQTQAEKRNQFAAAGLSGNSATVQYILKNSRFEALTNEKNISNNLQISVYENNAQAAEQIRALKATALANRQSAYKSGLGTMVSNLLGGF